ncbi:MAG: hypothetical protein AB1714_13155 [Acidobacteriota bacterium]
MSPTWALYSYIICSYAAGIVLCLAPWSTLWDHNYFVELLGIRDTIASGWVRGAISGLGAVNLMLAIRSILSISKLPAKTTDAGQHEIEV